MRSLAALLFLFGCVRPNVDFLDRPCPCADGWRCVDAGETNRCERTSLRDAGPDTPDAALDAPDAAPPRSPDPDCLVADVADSTIVSDVVTTGMPMRLQVSKPDPLTNVEMELCTPEGSRRGALEDVEPMFTWFFVAPPIAPGETQVIFRADPDRRIYGTRRLDIGGVLERPDLCTEPADSRIDGSFEAGFSDDAPTGWTVTDPAAPGRCPGGHLRLVDDPLCAGQALEVDPRGTPGCYAVHVDAGVDAGRSYRVSYVARADGRRPTDEAPIVRVEWHDASGEIDRSEDPPRTFPNFDWERVSWDAVAPAGAIRARVVLTAETEGRVVIDAVSFVAL